MVDLQTCLLVLANTDDLDVGTEQITPRYPTPRKINAGSEAAMASVDDDRSKRLCPNRINLENNRKKREVAGCNARGNTNALWYSGEPSPSTGQRGNSGV